MQCSQTVPRQNLFTSKERKFDTVHNPVDNRSEIAAFRCTSLLSRTDFEQIDLVSAVLASVTVRATVKLWLPDHWEPLRRACRATASHHAKKAEGFLQDQLHRPIALFSALWLSLDCCRPCPDRLESA